MKQINAILELINKFGYIVKIAKAALAGFDTFQNELAKSVSDGKE